MNSKTKKFVNDARPWPNSDAPVVKAGAAGGLTIVELLVVMGIIAAVIALAVPAINSMEKSYNSSGAASMINSALSAARTLATTRQQYVGLRFQKAWKTTDDALAAEQYMIFIERREDSSTLTNEFHAVKGYKPIKLPANAAVMDLTGITSLSSESDLIEATTFTIAFSPSGRLVIHDVQTRNKDGETGTGSKDNIFNVQTNVDDGKAMFVQDDTHKPSRNQLRICDREKFDKLKPADRYSYVRNDIQPLYINAYTGAIIK